MVDKNMSIGQIISQNPYAADILMSYGIPCYGHTENQLSSLEDVAIRYGVDINSMLSAVSNNNGGGLF